MIVGCSGYGFTGSSAVVDLLKEYDEIRTPPSGKGVTEFTIPYTYSGLLNLEFHVMKAPVKHLGGDNAIYSFKKLATTLEKSMNRITNGKFMEITDEYLDSIVQVTYQCHRGGSGEEKLRWLWERTLKTIQTRLERKYHRNFHLLKEDTRYICVEPEQFAAKTRDYVRKLIDAMGLSDGEHITLLDQPFPPNKPEQVFHFFEDPYAIIVNRDPRDIYVQCKHLRYSVARFIPHDTVENFVKYFRAVSSHAENEDPKRVLRIQFEDLVYNYEETVNRIEAFLQISSHSRPKSHFDPAKSIRNTQMMDLFPEDKDDIAYIERELPEYLFPFEKYEKVTSREGIYGRMSVS